MESREVSDKLWFLAGILLRRGQPSTPSELVTDCCLLKIKADEISSLCTLPNSPLRMTEHGEVTFSPLVCPLFHGIKERFRINSQHGASSMGSSGCENASLLEGRVLVASDERPSSKDFSITLLEKRSSQDFQTSTSHISKKRKRSSANMENSQIVAWFHSKDSRVAQMDSRKPLNCCFGPGTDKLPLFTCLHSLYDRHIDMHIFNPEAMMGFLKNSDSPFKVDTCTDLKCILGGRANERPGSPINKISWNLHLELLATSQNNLALDSSNICWLDQKYDGLVAKVVSLNHHFCKQVKQVYNSQAHEDAPETCSHGACGDPPEQTGIQLRTVTRDICNNLLQAGIEDKDFSSSPNIANLARNSQLCVHVCPGAYHNDNKTNAAHVESHDTIYYLSGDVCHDTDVSRAAAGLLPEKAMQTLNVNSVDVEFHKETLAEDNSVNEVSECKDASADCNDVPLSKGRGKRKRCTQKVQCKRLKTNNVLDTDLSRGGKVCLDANSQLGRAFVNNNVQTNVKQHGCEQKVPTFEGFAVEGIEGSGGYGTVYRAVRKSDGKLFAIKYPYEKTSPKYVSNEIMMLKNYGGKHFIPMCEGVIEASGRNCLVLEYIEHEKPEVLKKEITISDIQTYGYSLFRALAYLHEKGVTHRDVKPGNFLFSRQRRSGSLVDFNLAVVHVKQVSSNNRKNIPLSHEKASKDWTSNTNSELSSGYSIPRVLLTDRDRKTMNEKAYMIESSVLSSKEKKRISILQNTHQVEEARQGQLVSTQGFYMDTLFKDKARIFHSPVSGRALQSNDTASPTLKRSRAQSVVLLSPSREQDGILHSGTHSGADLSKEPLPRTGRRELLNYVELTLKSPQPSVALQPALQRKRVAAPQKKKFQVNASNCGFSRTSTVTRRSRFVMPQVPRNPSRMNGSRRNRKEGSCAGTKGYRAPEVLLRSLFQSAKLDVWSAGVTLLHLIAGRSPFPSSSAEHSLTDIARLRGADSLIHLAKEHNREDSLSKEFCIQRFEAISVKEWCMSYSKRKEMVATIPPALFDLIEKCLQVNPQNRISAAEAAKHEFFSPCHRAVTTKKKC